MSDFILVDDEGKAILFSPSEIRDIWKQGHKKYTAQALTGNFPVCTHEKIPLYNGLKINTGIGFDAGPVTCIGEKCQNFPCETVEDRLERIKLKEMLEMNYPKCKREAIPLAGGATMEIHGYEVTCIGEKCLNFPCATVADHLEKILQG